ncbi:MAG: hypothetical protein JWM11_5375 [Planctomycetaceae bacterium]|nr:hypothetical protein [Planctomycetaceae bacterium]
MSDRPLDQMPLRDLFSHAEHQARDLADHLDLNFLPKLSALEELAHPKPDAEEVGDFTVRSRAAQVLDSDEFTRQQLQKMRDYLNAIENALRTRK